MKRKDLRKLKYRTIKNKFHDTDLAKRAREWSEEKIYKELGITIPRKMPKLRKEVKETTKRRIKTELYKYQSIRDKLIDEGINENDAIRIAYNNRRKSYKNIERVIEKYKPIDYVITPKENEWDYIKVDYLGTTVKDRIKLWSNWSKNDNYPNDIVKTVEMINKEKNLDKQHSLGWAVVYQAFLHDQDINILKEYYDIVDKGLPEMYITTGSLRYQAF